VENHKSNTNGRSKHAMKKILRAALVLGFVVCLTSTGAQESSVKAPNDVARIRTEIRQGKREAIVEAGNSRNPVFLSELKNIEGSKIAKQQNLSRPIRIALAKLGDDAALQETYCYVEGKYYLVKYSAIQFDLTEIGGWFSIQLLLRQFDEDFTHLKLDPMLTVTDPAILALIALSNVIKDSPLPISTALESPITAPQARIGAWKRRINANSSSLKTRQPIGKHLNTSANACKKYHSVERLWLEEVFPSK